MEFKKLDKKTEDGKFYYDIQTEIVQEALNSQGHCLDELVRLMRKRCDLASVIYFCGTRLDSDFCFGSSDLAFAISALPQDARKAAKPGYHPKSTEVYIIFQGSLIIELLDQGTIREEALNQYGVLLIAPGQCHRVRIEPKREAASFIVKTNPHHEPEVVRCESCTYYVDVEICPLRRSWAQDK